MLRFPKKFFINISWCLDIMEMVGWLVGWLVGEATKEQGQKSNRLC